MKDINSPSIKSTMTNNFKKTDKSKVYAQTIILIGPVGVGKTLLSKELSKIFNLPLITTDIMRHCPKTMQEIKKRQQEIQQQITKMQNAIETNNLEIQNEINLKIKKLNNEMWVNNRREQMRNLLPNLSNYEELGYNEDFAKHLHDNYGWLASNFYDKQFENQLLQQLVAQLDFPCIIDLGGGISVSFDKEFSKLKKQFTQTNETLFTKNFDLSLIGFSHIKKALKPFKNIIELQLPNNYDQMTKAKNNNDINDLIIQSKQNSQLATQTISVEGLIDGDKVSFEKVQLICEQIEKSIIKSMWACPDHP